VHRPRHDEHDVRAAFELCEVLGRVVSDLTEPAAVEEANHRHVLRKIEDARGARARLVAEPDLGIRVPGDRVHDGGLPGLYLAEQPYDGRALARELADPALL